MAQQPMRVALPKGRLMDETLAYFAFIGILTSSSVDVGRRLVVRLDDVPGVGIPLELLLLKNADVPTYVEHGVAELGVCGTDVLEEASPAVYEPATLPFGSCRIAIAGRIGTTLDALRSRDPLRVATKYPRIAGAFFRGRGWRVELIKLGGSVELAAVLGLSDVIVDLVETGQTLTENRLHVLEVIGHTQVKLIANRSLTGVHLDATASIVDAIERASSGGETPS